MRLFLEQITISERALSSEHEICWKRWIKTGQHLAGINIIFHDEGDPMVELVDPSHARWLPPPLFSYKINIDATVIGEVLGMRVNVRDSASVTLLSA